MSDGLLYALGEADANMYLCSKELRPSKLKRRPFCSTCIKMLKITERRLPS